MPTHLSPEQRALGRENANTTLGVTRRDFLKAAAVVGGGTAAYFGYGAMVEKKPVRAAIVGTGDEGCQAMIRYHNRDYVDYIGRCDIRPSQRKRALLEFTNHVQYGERDAKKIKEYEDIDALLKDDDVELVVIALPLFLHAPIAIQALEAGKHVFCEKLMAHNITDCKKMVRAARKANKLLAIGHQRHYSVLYDNANFLVQNGHLGEIRHIRALWHRNNAQPVIAKKDGKLLYNPDGTPIYAKDDKGLVKYFDSWKRDLPLDDKDVPFAKYDYDSLDQLIRWRLYKKTGAGLMAELGSHQLDACSIFLGKKHPIAVTGVGGTIFYEDGREVDDHVFCTYEFPGLHDKDRVVVTYSSISTNAFEKYGETVMGSKGTLIVEEEHDLLLFREPDRNNPKAGGAALTTAVVEKAGAAGGKPTLETSPSAAGPSAASAIGGLATADPSRGYREELEHFAYCIRHGDPSNYHKYADLPREEFEASEEAKRLTPRCRGEVALADAVIALTSNLSMGHQQRIEFKPEWFDYTKDDAPDSSPGDLARRA
ncbi:MAG TPA: Gfo/Idh/MocA family oxidoreductase [Isosphaeraceae bacterium]|jgi:predicted dehydrogenase|nr:Gfo/Idh/MocA family oxidoreductase [Isosphaeraceae bacterium]